MRKAFFRGHAVSARLARYRRRPLSLAIAIAVCFAALLTVGLFLAIVGHILINGVPHLSLRLFEWKYTSENASMMPALINTLITVSLCMGIAVPIGVASAVYLSEYAGREGRIVRLIRITAETLAGIPSIVYGLFGYLFFNMALGLGYSILSGALTLSLMSLPTILRTAEEALRAVPVSHREASFGLGAGKLRTVLRVVLPAARGGILSGVMLALGRAIGETAALIYTAGTFTRVASSLVTPGCTLSVHLYVLLSEGLYTDEAYATAVVLLILVALINLFSVCLTRRGSARKGRI